MLQFLLKWKTYRTFKNGLLLDYIVKRFSYYISKFFFVTFTVFFGDKYILEHMFSNVSRAINLLVSKVLKLNKNSFIRIFNGTILILLYILLIIFILYII